MNENSMSQLTAENYIRVHKILYLLPPYSQNGTDPSFCARYGGLNEYLYSNLLWTRFALTKYNSITNTNTNNISFKLQKSLPMLTIVPAHSPLFYQLVFLKLCGKCTTLAWWGILNLRDPIIAYYLLQSSIIYEHYFRLRHTIKLLISHLIIVLSIIVVCLYIILMN